MKLKSVLFYSCLIVAATVLIRIHPAASQIALSRRSVPEVFARRLAQQYGKLPLRFESNQGQNDGAVKFLSRGAGYTLFLNSDEAVLSLSQSQVAAPGKAGA